MPATQDRKELKQSALRTRPFCVRKDATRMRIECRTGGSLAGLWAHVEAIPAAVELILLGICYAFAFANLKSCHTEQGENSPEEESFRRKLCYITERIGKQIWKIFF